MDVRPKEIESLVNIDSIVVLCVEAVCRIDVGLSKPRWIRPQVDVRLSSGSSGVKTATPILQDISFEPSHHQIILSRFWAPFIVGSESILKETSFLQVGVLDPGWRLLLRVAKFGLRGLPAQWRTSDFFFTFVRQLLDCAECL